MPGTMHLPGVGEVKKGYVYAGGAITVGIIGYAYYKRKSANATAAASATTTPATDPSIDPATGVPYSQESGYGSGFGSPYSDYGGSYYGSGSITGYDQYGNPVYSTGITGNQAYTTNSGWATQAENDLQGAGVDYATAATAISKILAGLQVTTAQKNLFLEAVGLDGQPPQGYPQPIKVVDTPAQPTGNPGGTPTGVQTTTVPNVVGGTAGNAHNKIAAAGLIPTAIASQKAYQKVRSTVPGAGTTVNKGSRVQIIT